MFTSTHNMVHIVSLVARSDAVNTVSRILHHIHPCLIYEAIMRHIRDEYEAIMKPISIIFSKNEVVGAAIFVYCQTTIKL